MKRILALLLILLPLTLCACGDDAHTLGPYYEGHIRSTDGVVNYTASLSANGDELRLSLTSPASVAGMTYEIRGGELHTSLNGLDCVTSPDSLPPTSLPALLYALFSRCDEAAFQSFDNGVDTFSLSTADGDMIVTAVDGVPQTVVSGSRTIFFS